MEHSISLERMKSGDLSLFHNLPVHRLVFANMLALDGSSARRKLGRHGSDVDSMVETHSVGLILLCRDSEPKSVGRIPIDRPYGTSCYTVGSINRIVLA